MCEFPARIVSNTEIRQHINIQKKKKKKNLQDENVENFYMSLK